jgi:glycosyltransferase involved in cell wall biosynthesis
MIKKINYPIVSVVIPVFNGSRYIKNAIESALNQKEMEYLEILVVDDGSTDDTAIILKSYLEQKKIKYFYKKNNGAASARNFGIIKAQGKYISFLDADDFWDKYKTVLQLNAAMDNPKSVILSDVLRFTETNSNISTFGKTSPPPYNNRSSYLKSLFFLKNNEMANFHSALVAKEALLNVGLYDETLGTAEDWDLWIRLAFKYSFANISKPLLYYRKHQDSQTKSYALISTFQNQLKVVNKNCNLSMLDNLDLNKAVLERCKEFSQILENRRSINGLLKIVIKLVKNKKTLHYKGTVLFICECALKICKIIIRNRGR